MNFWGWAAIAAILILAFAAFVLGGRLATALGRHERDELVKMYSEKLAVVADGEKRALDRWKTLLDDVRESGDDNEALAKKAEGMAYAGDGRQQQIAERCHGRAAAFRQILTRYRG
jgi:hypothetical protein